MTSSDAEKRSAPERAHIDAPSGGSENSGGAFDCDSCGACCKTWRILVADEDAAREPRIAHEARRLPDNQRTEHWAYQLFPLPFHETCVFLDPANRCTIYDTRPRVCRAFEAGSQRCQEARAEQGLGPLAPAVIPLTINNQKSAWPRPDGSRR